jgi:hypothetical protein
MYIIDLFVRKLRGNMLGILLVIRKYNYTWYSLRPEKKCNSRSVGVLWIFATYYTILMGSALVDVLIINNNSWLFESCPIMEWRV